MSYYKKSTLHNDHLLSSMLLTRFFTLMRFGELTDPDTVSLRDPRKWIWHLLITISHDNYSFFLPGYKSKKFFEGNMIIVPHSTNSHNTYCHFTSYLNSRDSSLQPLAMKRQNYSNSYVVHAASANIFQQDCRRSINASRWSNFVGQDRHTAPPHSSVGLVENGHI